MTTFYYKKFHFLESIANFKTFYEFLSQVSATLYCTLHLILKFHLYFADNFHAIPKR